MCVCVCVRDRKKDDELSFILKFHIVFEKLIFKWKKIKFLFEKKFSYNVLRYIKDLQFINIMYFCLHCLKFSSLCKSWCSGLTVLFGVNVANYNLICEITALCIEEIIEKTRLQILVVYVLQTSYICMTYLINTVFL